MITTGKRVAVLLLWWSVWCLRFKATLLSKNQFSLWKHIHCASTVSPHSTVCCRLKSSNQIYFSQKPTILECRFDGAGFSITGTKEVLASIASDCLVDDGYCVNAVEGKSS